MKQITANIPDKKLSFILELLESLGISASESSFKISSETKNLVRSRIKTATKKNYSDWSKAKKKLKFD